MTATRTSNPASTSRRFTARTRRRQILRGITMLLVLGMVGGVIWLVGYSNVLSVNDVRVAGADGKLADHVLEVVDAPLGEPLARVDTGEVADRVDDIHEVSAVEVKRSWPRALTIEVTQREPVAAVPDDSSWWQIDAEGVLFGETSKRPKGLPVVEVSADADDQSERAMGAAVIGSLPASVVKRVDLARVESVADVQLDLKNGSTVVWGTNERADDKAAVLQALLKDHKGDEVTYNVSAPDNPAVVP